MQLLHPTRFDESMGRWYWRYLGIEGPVCEGAVHGHPKRNAHGVRRVGEAAVTIETAGQSAFHVTDSPIGIGGSLQTCTLNSLYSPQLTECGTLTSDEMPN
jgi:hypothetical protein